MIFVIAEYKGTSCSIKPNVHYPANQTVCVKGQWLVNKKKETSCTKEEPVPIDFDDECKEINL